MSKKYIKIICLVVGSLMLLTLVACGGSSSSTSTSTAAVSSAQSSAAASTVVATPAAPVTITMKTHYNNDNEKPPVDDALAKLKTDFPNVTIQPEGYDNDNGTALKARIASGDLPDIFEIATDNIDLCIKNSSIIPLDKYVTQDLTDIMSPAVSENLKYTDGKIWGLPVYGPMAHLMFYNKDVFDSNGIKLPTNFDELLTAVKAFNAKGITPITVPGKVEWAAGALFDIFAQRINPRGFMAIQDGSAKASDFKDAAVKIATLVKANAFEKGAATSDYDPTRALFHTGKAAMLINGEWEVSEGQKDLGDKLQYLTQFPVMDAGKEYANPGLLPGGTILDDFAISAQAKNPDFIAKVLCKYYQYYQDAQFTKMQVIWSTVKTDSLTPEKPFAALVTKYVGEKASLKPGSNTWLGYSPNTNFDTAFYQELQKLLAGESADTFITNVDKLATSTKK
jgi:raffinose/stachyose/melibiose transport system substrate-binding protein